MLSLQFSYRYPPMSLRSGWIPNDDATGERRRRLSCCGQFRSLFAPPASLKPFELIFGVPDVNSRRRTFQRCEQLNGRFRAKSAAIRPLGTHWKPALACQNCIDGRQEVGYQMILGYKTLYADGLKSV